MRVALICVGNELLMDDGLGSAVGRRMGEKYVLPDNVAVLDCAVMGYAILPDLQACDLAVVVDAVDGTGAAPGTLFSFAPEDMRGATSAEMMSLHEVRFADVLAAARFMGASCQAQCFGAQVENAHPSELHEGLSEPVAAAVDPLCAQIAAFIAQTCGITLVPRA